MDDFIPFLLLLSQPIVVDTETDWCLFRVWVEFFVVEKDREKKKNSWKFHKKQYSVDFFGNLFDIPTKLEKALRTVFSAGKLKLLQNIFIVLRQWKLWTKIWENETLQRDSNRQKDWHRYQMRTSQNNFHVALMWYIAPNNERWAYPFIDFLFYGSFLLTLFWLGFWRNNIKYTHRLNSHLFMTNDAQPIGCACRKFSASLTDAKAT